MSSVPGKRILFMFANRTQSKKKQSYQSITNQIP